MTGFRNSEQWDPKPLPSNVVDLTQYTGQTEAVEQPAKNFSDFLETVGGIFSKKGMNLTPDQLRHKGTAILAGAGIAIGALAGPGIIKGFEYSGSTGIPASEGHIDKDKYRITTIPQTGAFNFAEKVDPNHDPRNGVQQFEKQLGHAPEPGDIVAIPKNG